LKVDNDFKVMRHYTGNQTSVGERFMLQNSDRKSGTLSVKSVFNCIQLKQHYRTVRHVPLKYRRAESKSVVVKQKRVITFSVQIKSKNHKHIRHNKVKIKIPWRGPGVCKR
jgi:hypothetical protein